MVSPLLRPRWLVGHVLVVVTIAAFVALGFWQLRRHAEVRELRDAVAAAQVLPVVPVEEAAMYRRVVATGEYDHEVEAWVLRSRAGESGYLILTPLVLDDGTAILVNRSWVPLTVDTRPPVPEAQVTVEGYLWPAEEGSWQPEALPEIGQVVRRIDPMILDRFTEYAFRDGYMIVMDGAPPTISSGPHFAYAVQWFLFAVIVVAGYPMLLRRAAHRG
jgi:surfeit locus 1 family protein